MFMLGRVFASGARLFMVAIPFALITFQNAAPGSLIASILIIAAGASLYTTLFGLVAVAHSWAIQCVHALNNPGPYSDTKLKTARYYFANVLPGAPRPFAPGQPRHAIADRAEVVSYLEDYLASVDPPLETGVDVTSVSPSEGRWQVHAEDGRTWSARAVVCCTGISRRPVRPEALASALPEATPQFLLDLVATLGIYAHFDAIARGVVDLRDLIYFVSLIGFCLFANALIVDWKKS